MSFANAATAEWGVATPAEFAPAIQNTSPIAWFNSLSCVSAGNCTAAGRFRHSDGEVYAFTMTSTDGVWGQATQAEFADGFQHASSLDEFLSVSCASAGNCTAAGSFKNLGGNSEAFTMTSTDGVWGQATPAVFAAGVEIDPRSSLFRSVSCASAGECTAAGNFKNATNGIEVFTMTSTDGVWGQATPAVFAAGVQYATPLAQSNSVSCVSAGDCTAVGRFRNANASYSAEAFTMTSTDGVWGLATPAVFAAGVQSTTQNAEFYSVSCASAGNCTAVGKFKNATNGFEAFTMTSTDGVWGLATPAVFAAGVQNTTPSAQFNSVSCASAGNCTAVGKFKNATNGFEAFTMTSTDGVWGLATPAVFAAGVQNTGPNASFDSVSCASAGNCAIAGSFKNATGTYESFTMTSTDGVWGLGRPSEFANGQRRDGLNPPFLAVACPSTGNCTAAGRFESGNNEQQAFTMALTTTLTVTYDSQGGSAVNGGDTTASGGKVGVLPGDPTREGYTFVGWFTAASGGAQVTAGGVHGQTSDFTLYAQWTANPVESSTTTVPATTTTVPATTTTVPATTTTVPATTTTVATPSALVAPDGAVLFEGVGPELEPGTGEILEGDSWDEVSARTSEVGSELVRDDNEVVLQPVNSDGSPVPDDDFEIRLSGECSGADCSIETVTDANGVSREVMRLQTVDGVARATGSGFQPGTEVKLWLFSDPMSLGTAKVASDGTFAVAVPLDGVTPGEHTLQANGVTADLKARTAHVGVVLDPSSTKFPATGGSSSPMVWAVLTVSLGLIMMIARRRLDVGNYSKPE